MTEGNYNISTITRVGWGYFLTEGAPTPYLLNAIQALSQHTRKRTPHRTKVATLLFAFTFYL